MNKEENEKKIPQSALLESWVKASMDFWKAKASMWPPAFGGAPSASEPTGKKGEERPSEDPIRMFNEIWQTLFSLVSKPQAGDYNQVGSFYESMLKLSQPFLTGYLEFQKQWMQEEGKGKASLEIEGFTNLAQEMTRFWSEKYEKEFGQFLKIPQLGLTRFYQERANRTIETFTYFQNALTDLMQLLLIPMEKAYIAVQEVLKNLDKQGNEALKNSKAYYQLWIKTMEEKYMILLKSPEYTDTLGKTMKALHDFRVARSQLLIDILQDLPIPTNRDMDELYKDLYLLKKRVKELEKKVKSHEK
jgi:poly[(R)-3-hydroxyalkanoate] polymerase subunit PhaE